MPTRTPLPLRRLLAVAAGLLALVLVLQGALTLLDLMGRSETTTVRALGDVRSVVVDSDGGAVVVTAGAGPAQLRTVLVRGLFGGDAEVAVADAGQVRVRTDCPPLGSVTCTARHELRVPRGTTVRVRTGSGRVTLAGPVGAATLRSGSGRVDVDASVGGVLDVETGSGSVDVRGARAARVRLRTGSGEVRAEGLAAPLVTAETGSGEVSLATTVPPRALSARTGSGDVDVVVPDVVYAVSTDTGSGDADVTVTQDPDAPRQLALRTGSGDVTVRPGPPPARR